MLFVIVIGLDAGWSFHIVRSGLVSAEAHLRRASANLTAGKLSQAQAEFRLARDSAESALTFRLHPAGALASLLPWIGSQSAAVIGLGDTAVASADAGTELVRAARALGWDGSGAAALKRGGAVDLTLVKQSGPLIAQAAADLRGARVELGALNTQGLIAPLADKVSTARTAVGSKLVAVRSLSTTFDLVPGLLGGTATRRYFVGFQDLTEARGTGGEIGLYGVLTARDGRLSLGTVRSTNDLHAVDIRRTPGGPVERIRFDTNPNSSPDFPTTADLLLRMWRITSGQSLDGVILVNPLWMSSVLTVTGPIVVPAWHEPITADNVERVMMHDSFLLPRRRSSEVQVAIAQQLWDTLLTRQPSLRSLGTALGDSLADRNLLLYSTHSDEETRLQALDADGHFHPQERDLTVVWNDDLPNHAGYFAERYVDEDIALRDDGSAHVETVVQLHNTAPDGPPSPLLGYGRLLPMGLLNSEASIQLPRNARHIVVAGARGRVQVTTQASSLRFASGRLIVYRGRTGMLRVSYDIDGAATDTGGHLGYVFRILPQPAPRPIWYSVSVHAPPAAIEASGAPHLAGQTALYQGAPRAPVRVELEYRLPQH